MEINVSWPVFKSTVDSRSWKIQYLQLSGGANDGYYMSAGNPSIRLTCMVPVIDPENPSEEQVDFETNYKASANQDPVNGVQTQFEMPNYLLQMAHLSMLDMSDGETRTEMIRIPGEFNGVAPPANGRYIDAGEAWFTPGADGDMVMNIEVIDHDNLLGAGEDFVLGSYHDSQVAPENQGWALHTVYPVEVETLGWYGFIPSGMYLRITAKRGPGAVSGNFRCNISWGIKT